MSINVQAIAAGAIDIVGFQACSVDRITGALNAAGDWEQTAVATFTATGSITPAVGADLQRLPEGRRNLETRRFITRSELRSSRTTDQNPDLVTYDGATWEVEHVQRWTDGIFFDVIMTRREGA